jgi:hypothetical protein
MTCIANATTELDEHEEIEVTPEMIEAGISELALFEFADRGEWIVDAVYRAMAKARQNALREIKGHDALIGVAQKSF